MIFRTADKPCVRVWFVFLFALAALGCSARDAEQPQTGLEKRRLLIISASGPVMVEAELARTDKEHAVGLMFRRELAAGAGMLFIFEDDQVRSFWMKNTFIPLSIAYILYDGTIVDIRDMRPGDLSPVHSSRSARYALEVPQGWFASAGIRPGDRLDLETLR